MLNAAFAKIKTPYVFALQHKQHAGVKQVIRRKTIDVVCTQFINTSTDIHISFKCHQINRYLSFLIHMISANMISREIVRMINMQCTVTYVAVHLNTDSIPTIVHAVNPSTFVCLEFFIEFHLLYIIS